MTQVIAIEGITKCGKTTQCELVKSELKNRGMKVEVVPEFANSIIGKLAEQIAFRKVATNPHAGFLVFVANDWEKSAWIAENRNKNNFIIVDGFIEQVLAYESDSLKKPLKAKSIKWFYSFFKGLPVVPDVSLILQPSWSEVSGRLGNEPKAHYKNAFDNFKILSRYGEKNSGFKTLYQTINVANLTKEQVTSEIIAILRSRF